MASEQHRAIVLRAVEKKLLEPSYQFSSEEISAINAVLDHHFAARYSSVSLHAYLLKRI